MNKEEFREWAKYNKSKVGALVVAFLYLLPALLTADIRGLIAVVFFLAIALACIFFGDIMGGAMGSGRGGGVPAINKMVPGGFMVFIGWALLLAPLLAAIFMEVLNKNR